MKDCESCAAVARAIGTVEFMDPPDGGDTTLAEQVARMKRALDLARAAPLPEEWVLLDTATGEFVEAWRGTDLREIAGDPYQPIDRFVLSKAASAPIGSVPEHVGVRLCAACGRVVENPFAQGVDGKRYHLACAKRAKAEGRQLSPEEAAQLRERLGIKGD